MVDFVVYPHGNEKTWSAVSGQPRLQIKANAYETCPDAELS